MCLHYRPKLLIVDDNLALLESLRFGLEAHFLALTACNGPEALELTRHFHPQVVMLDYEMHGMNGLELAKKLLQCFPDLPIVFCSSALSPELIQQAKEIGITDCQKKPFDIEQVIKRLLEISKIEE
jgi:CheY-like chemotaxis protein